jgi:hypothetical protein
VTKRTKVGEFTISLDDPHLPATLEFLAARCASAGDLDRVQGLRDKANEVRRAQEEFTRKRGRAETAEESADSGEADESGVHS